MDLSQTKYEIDRGIAKITLHRPDSMNAFTPVMRDELITIFAEADMDDAVRVVVITGAGKAFCAGADMSAGEDTFAKQDSQSFSAAGFDPPAWQVRKPVIAAMNGHAIGIGFTMALQCDMRIVADEGKYGVLQVRRGMMPDCYSHWTLPRIVGLERAAYILLTGKRFTGVEVVELGIAMKSLPSEEVLPAAMEIAWDIAQNTAPLSVAIAKRLLWESPNLTAADVERKETALHHHLMGRPDAIEGPVAWLERRKPEWKSTVNNDWPDWPG
jgi:enoyl-CoA hydratase/carnithine racemase